MIKKSYVIITLSSLITFSLTNTMDKPIDQHVHKILPFSDVHGAAFLGNNQLIIQTNNRTNNRTLLIDLTQNIDPLELANYTNHGFCKMLTNQKKTAVIIYNSFKNQEKATIFELIDFSLPQVRHIFIFLRLQNTVQ